MKPRSFNPAKPTPAPHNRVKPMKLDSRPSRLPKAGTEATTRNAERLASPWNLPRSVIADNGKEFHNAEVVQLLVTAATQIASAADHKERGAP